MIYRTPREKIDEYYNNNSLNQSAIKEILYGGMESFLAQADVLKTTEDKYYKEEEHFIIGKAVDCYITEGKECFDASYHTSKVSKPSDGILAVVKQVHDRLIDYKTRTGQPIGELKEYQELIYDCCNHNKYYMNRARPSAKDLETNDKLPEDSPKYITWLNDNRWLDIVKGGTAYFDDLKQADGKQVLSTEEGAKVTRIIESLTTHQFTSWLFQDGPNIDIIYQLPLYFVIDGIYCKALPDELRIDHNLKTIAIPDIKTTRFYVSTFKRVLKQRRYDIQGSFYKAAVILSLPTISGLIGKDLTGYRIANPAFVVESTVKQGTPLIFPITEGLINVGEKGNGVDLQGWRQGIELYKLWQEKSFSIDDMFYQWKGIIHIDENFEYLNHF